MNSLPCPHEVFLSATLVTAVWEGGDESVKSQRSTGWQGWLDG